MQSKQRTSFIIDQLSQISKNNFYYVQPEPAPTRQPHAKRPRCEKPCTQPSDCRKPCKRCNNGLWGDSLCKT
uniref:Putative 5.3 kDa protein n=1 Tax=Ixodes ricinus TaxID=34613 RepID=A0A6B0U346_IXORI